MSSPPEDYVMGSSPPRNKTPNGMEAALRTVVIPVDGSPDSDRAFVWYIKHMKRSGDCVKIVHVPEPVSLPLISLSEGKCCSHVIYCEIRFKNAQFITPLEA